jgi:hypothetical protein
MRLAGVLDVTRPTCTACHADPRRLLEVVALTRGL